MKCSTLNDMGTPKIPVVDLNISEKEIQAVKEVVQSHYLVEGPHAREFERKFADFTGSKYVATASNGTCALHLALTALDIGPKDEVITTPFTFIASSNTILFNGAIPIFVDIDPSTYNMDPSLIEDSITENTKAIMPVHIFGNPCDMKAIQDIAEDHDLLIIEDCAQAHDAKIRNVHVGNFSDIGAFSFYGTKNLIGGEGGALVCNTEEIHDKIVSLKNHGRSLKGGYSHYQIGYNYRTTDMSAAIMNVQMDRASEILLRRHRNGKLYRKLLDNCEAIRYQEILDSHQHSDYIFAPVLQNTTKTPEEIIIYLKSKGIQSRTIYNVLTYEQPAYININSWHMARVVDYPNYKDLKCPNAEFVARNHFELPMVSTLSDENIDYIVTILRDFLCN